jgi:hypothetical protein
MFKLVVELDDLKVEIPRVAMRELVNFERHFNASAAVLKEGRLEHVAWLAWAGLKRAGHVNGDTPFDDDFLDRLGVIEVSESAPSSGTAETVPTPPSPGSPSPPA